MITFDFLQNVASWWEHLKIKQDDAFSCFLIES